MLPELLGLPEVPFEGFEDSPLVLAMCQVRFSNVLGLADSALIGPFQREIQDRYPVSQEIAGLEMQVSLEHGEPEIREKGAVRSFRFADSTDNWAVVLAQDFVSVETRAYERFSDFLARLRQVLIALNRHVRPTIRTRIGLRYVNEIRPGHSNWASIVREELLGPLTVSELTVNTTALTAVQQLLLRYPNNLGINIRHGTFLDGTTVQPLPGQEPERGLFYLLDFDAFHEAQTAMSLPVDTDEICQYVESFNRAIYRLFRWALKDDYLSSLGAYQYDTD